MKTSFSVTYLGIFELDLEKLKMRSTVPVGHVAADPEKESGSLVPVYVDFLAVVNHRKSVVAVNDIRACRRRGCMCQRHVEDFDGDGCFHQADMVSVSVSVNDVVVCF